MFRAAHTRFVALFVLLGACEYDLDVGPAWQIDVPRVIAIRMVVVEPSPTWPERIGHDDDDAPIAEALPGDRVELQALAVDAEGRPRAPGSLDALWFQCGFDGKEHFEEARCVIDAPPCDSVDEWTTDTTCELGRGGALELTFPAFGPYGFSLRKMPLLALIAREPGIDVEDCRTDILAGTNYYSSDRDTALPPASTYERDSPACTMVESTVLIGPHWALPFLAADAGFDPEVPLEQIPYLTLYQPANRAPAPKPPTWMDADTNVPLEGSPPRVRPGQRVTTKGPNWRVADRQLYAYAEQVHGTDSFVFVGNVEGLGVVYLASGPIVQLESKASSLQFTVDEYPSTSTIRIVMIVGDRREHDVEASAINVQVIELEVVR